MMVRGAAAGVDGVCGLSVVGGGDGAMPVGLVVDVCVWDAGGGFDGGLVEGGEECCCVCATDWVGVEVEWCHCGFGKTRKWDMPLACRLRRYCVSRPRTRPLKI